MCLCRTLVCTPIHAKQLFAWNPSNPTDIVGSGGSNLIERFTRRNRIQLDFADAASAGTCTRNLVKCRGVVPVSGMDRNELSTPVCFCRGLRGNKQPKLYKSRHTASSCDDDRECTHLCYTGRGSGSKSRYRRT